MQLKVARAVTVLALALWLGGLVTLGALVAPAVFGIVPAPTSADAMTVVFRRFDRVALVCAALVALGEVLRANRAKSLTRLDLARSASALLAALLAGVEAGWLSPQIEELHHRGAIRGLGALGAELEHAHHLAELLAKSELVFLVVFAVLFTLTPPLEGEPTNVETKRNAGRAREDAGADEGQDDETP